MQRDGQLFRDLLGLEGLIEGVRVECRNRRHVEWKVDRYKVRAPSCHMDVVYSSSPLKEIRSGERMNARQGSLVARRCRGSLLVC
jgi:hypothetical protein